MSDSIEDLLILKYQENHPGKIYKEVFVGKVENKMRRRRIDAILIEGKRNEVYERGEYKIAEVKNEIKNEKIHILEAKKNLNRNVIGQVEVGKYLIKNDFEPREIIPVALCANTHPDIKKYCKQKNIKAEIYNMNINNSVSLETDEAKVKEKQKVIDKRTSPNREKFGAFKRGWKDAQKGKLYNSVKNKRTHTSIGNLFGWIYGECSNKMKKRVWEQYIKNSREYLDINW
ncbi:MAG: hypothetical protein ACQEQF_03620 [Bacillota bacterium]